MITVSDVRRMLAGGSLVQTAEIIQGDKPLVMPAEEHTDYPTADVTARASAGHLTDSLVVAGFYFATHIAQANQSDLTAIPGIGKKTAEKLQAAAKELLA